MKITKITDSEITFSDGSLITFGHERDCCEWNWADFLVLNADTINIDYDFPKIKFRAVEGAGFKFGIPGHWLFVPCYSDQNGYYSDAIDIYFNGVEVLHFNAEERRDY